MNLNPQIDKALTNIQEAVKAETDRLIEASQRNNEQYKTLLAELITIKQEDVDKIRTIREELRRVVDGGVHLSYHLNRMLDLTAKVTEEMKVILAHS